MNHFQLKGSFLFSAFWGKNLHLISWDKWKCIILFLGVSKGSWYFEVIKFAKFFLIFAFYYPYHLCQYEKYLIEIGKHLPSVLFAKVAKQFWFCYGSVPLMICQVMPLQGLDGHKSMVWILASIRLQCALTHSDISMKYPLLWQFYEVLIRSYLLTCIL